MVNDNLRLIQYQHKKQDKIKIPKAKKIIITHNRTYILHFGIQVAIATYKTGGSLVVIREKSCRIPSWVYALRS